MSILDGPDDLSRPLSEHAVAYPADQLSLRVAEHVKANLLDVIGVTIAGVNEEGLGALRSFLDEELWSSKISTKPFPGGRPTHALMEAALALRSTSSERRIASVAVYVPSPGPWAGARTWPAGRAATYNLPFSVALVLATGRAPIDAFIHPDATPPEVRAVFDRITVVADPTGSAHGRVEVVYDDGATAIASAQRAYGHPGRPLSREDRLTKFWTCVEHGNTSMASDDLEQVVDLTDHFEKLPSTRGYTHLLGLPR